MTGGETGGSAEPGKGPERGQERLSAGRLLIASGASVAAAIATSALSVRGALISAAVTPVIVEVARELLGHPTARIERLLKRLRRRRGREEPEERRDAGPPHVLIAVLVGLLGFAAGALALTVAERAAGGAVATDRDTTLGLGDDEPDPPPPQPPPPTQPETETQTEPVPPAVVTIDPESVDFGAILAGAGATRSVEISNAGAQPVGVTIDATGLEETAFAVASPCPEPEIPAGASCTLELKFAAPPNAPPAEHAATLRLLLGEELREVELAGRVVVQLELEPPGD